MDDALAIPEECQFAIKLRPERLNSVLFALSIVGVILGGIIASGR
jgi:hypothetical protein